MNTDTLSLIGQLSDQQLVEQVKLLAQREHECTAHLIAHLAVLDERGLYRGEGCTSLFTYCLEVLHLSEHAAFGRIAAARAARRFPVILRLLGDGSVNLTTVTLLAPHLTVENHLAVLQAATNQRKRHVEELVAALRPQPVVPSSVRKLPAPNPTAAPVPAPDALQVDSGDGPLLTLTMPSRPPVIAPLAPESYKIQFTANTETYAKLRMAQELLHHQVRDGDVGEILDRALTALLKSLTKQKFAATDHPRQRREDRLRRDHHPASPERVHADARSRQIPAEVKRTVWARDGARCAFTSHKGVRCTAREFLEFHHVVPHAAGGEATVENIQLRCRAHNEYEAELHFGRNVYLGRRRDRRHIDATPPVGMVSTRSGPSSRSAPEPDLRADPP